jgi:hypothetical protein
MQLSPTSCHLPTLRSKHSHHHSDLQHLQSTSCLTHKTTPSLHHIHYNKNVYVTSHRRKLHTIPVKRPADALMTEDTESEELESHIWMKTDVASSYNGWVTQSILHCSICMLNCAHWWWARRIHHTTGPWNRVNFKVTFVYHHKNELATSYNMK